VRRQRVGLHTDVGQVVPHFAGCAELSVEGASVSHMNLRVGLARPWLRCRLALRSWRIVGRRSRLALRSRRSRLALRRRRRLVVRRVPVARAVAVAGRVATALLRLLIVA